MSLKEWINQDVRVAMKAREAERLAALRLLLAAIKQKEVDERIQLSDSDVIYVIEKMLKQRRESIAQFEAAARTDLADKEKYEISVLQVYMPQALSDQDVMREVEKAIAEVGATSMKDMGKVMSLVKSTVVGRADMSGVAAIIKGKLTT